MLTQETRYVLFVCGKYAPLTDQLRLMWWDVFAPEKRDALIEQIGLGVDWYSAMKSVRNNKHK